MLNIIHQPNLPTEKVIAYYTDKDGVPIKYVCTTSPGTGNEAGQRQNSNKKRQNNKRFYLVVKMDDISKLRYAYEAKLH